jgi:SpoVK/Ycf46/Vps4 family AAA+-type ATPase
LPSKLLHDIRSSVEGFAAARPLYQRMGLAYRRGLLFHGPPGNGKTLVCAAITTALQWPTIYVTADDRVDVGRELGSAFKQAADLAPVILCLEDIDALLNSSASLSAFLNRLDGCQAHEGLLVLATTNHPEKLDEALTSRPSRFDRIFHIGDPGLAQRQDYLGMLFGDHLSVTDRSEVAYVTEGMSMAFLKEILVSAATVAFSRGELPTRRDVDGALENLKQHRKQVVGGFMSRRSAGFAA